MRWILIPWPLAARQALLILELRIKCASSAFGRIRSSILASQFFQCDTCIKASQKSAEDIIFHHSKVQKNAAHPLFKVFFNAAPEQE